MKELSYFCQRMIRFALLLTTVSATKMNVPRLRLSYKGKIHSTTFIWSHLCFLVSYIDYYFIFKCFIISTTSKTRMGRNVLTDLGLQLGNNAIIILPNRLFIFNYVSSFENRFDRMRTRCLNMFCQNCLNKCITFFRACMWITAYCFLSIISLPTPM